MKRITVVAILFLYLGMSAQTENIFNRNGGELKHNIAGQAIGMVTGWVAYKKTNKMWVGILSCVLSSAIIGIAKEEIWDRKWHNGTPSDNDKLSTGFGGMVGAICLVPIMKCHSDKIYEAEQLCKDLKNPIFLRDSL